MKNRLLIISCSNRKRQFEYPESAWKVYDGVIFRLLREKEIEGTLPKDLNILILSSEFGLITPNSLITFYNRKMTAIRAKEMKYHVSQRLKQHLSDKLFDQILLSMGSTYLYAFEDIIWPADSDVGVVPGRIGEKISITKRWINKPEVVRPEIHWLQQKEDRDVRNKQYLR